MQRESLCKKKSFWVEATGEKCFSSGGGDGSPWQPHWCSRSAESLSWGEAGARWAAVIPLFKAVGGLARDYLL